MKKLLKKPEFDPGSRVQIEGAILRLQSFREHSEKELVQKCVARGFDASSVQLVLDELREMGLQSNVRYTESLLYSRQRKGFGPVRIAADLRSKGIEDDLIQQVLALSDETWQVLLERVIAKKFQGKIATEPKEKAKQLRYLQSRGFSAEQIWNWIKSDT